MQRMLERKKNTEEDRLKCEVFKRKSSIERKQHRYIEGSYFHII